MDWRAERDTTVAHEVATFPTPKIAPDNAIERIRHLEAQQKKLWSRRSVIVVALLTAATFWSIGFYVGLVVGRAHW
jgi:hypothetical protein